MDAVACGFGWLFNFLEVLLAPTGSYGTGRRNDGLVDSWISGVMSRSAATAHLARRGGEVVGLTEGTASWDEWSKSVKIRQNGIRRQLGVCEGGQAAGRPGRVGGLP